MKLVRGKIDGKTDRGRRDIGKKVLVGETEKQNERENKRKSEEMKRFRKKSTK